jgi:hypothetical protein
VFFGRGARKIPFGGICSRVSSSLLPQIEQIPDFVLLFAISIQIPNN